GDGHGRPQRNADRVVDAALPWLEEHSGQPFFCWLHFYDPHMEYLDHRESFGDRFKDSPYDAEIAYVDLQLRRLIDWLETRKIADETMIVVVGDHGEGLDEHRERWHGYLLYNSTLEVPLIVSHPPLRAAGTRVAAPVSIVDIGATVLDVLGIPDRDQFGGRSLKAALEGEALSADDCYAATDEGYLEEGWSPLRCLISDRWKYIRTTKPELYDLMSDPHELTNLADAHAETVRELEERLGALEARGFRHEAQPVGLSERERMVLDSLGYLGDPSPRDPADEGDRPDIKDSLEALFAFQGAQALYRTGRREEAMARLQTVIDEYPRYLAPQLMAGRMLESSGQLTRAREVFEEVLKAEADNKEANARVGKLLTTEGRWQEALPYLRRALTADARGNHAIVATSALPLLLQELERNPDSADLHYVVAKMLRALGRHPEAVAHMRAAEMSVRRSAPDRESSN
ncbi:MAG TPA: sulfatase-like hydrolase/transferase, partial [Planctomycetaceae bacterium]|nr:sulfatase-like hydrolase/transferase [Planctomycetaceae bacterium]